MYFIRLFLILFFFSCQNKEVTHLNINKEVKYVGMNTCASCHTEQYESFLRTGMGNSLRPALKKYSSSVFNQIIYDTALDLSYYPHWINDSLFIQEYALDNNDTIHNLTRKVDYIVGSGHHTNSHLINNNGYLYQAPFTFYTQDSILDVPPGFENSKNSRFDRKMGLECIACHNAYPDFVLGSENKYNVIPEGIDCERCHGAGELHVKNISQGKIIDTTHYVDYSIVNPKYLSNELQNDICARCHLQGNAVLQRGKNFFDFRPGMRLKDVMDVYLPRYQGLEDKFIMASHVDRMKLSKCYINSEEEMTCISCHNPHLSVKEMTPDYFNKKCFACHSFSHETCSSSNSDMRNNCISCHMPSSSTIDIPHVTITDHKIGIFESHDNKSNRTQDTVFLGLDCINNNNPSFESKVQAYLQQYERFEERNYYLDSALYYLNHIDLLNDLGIYIHFYYLFLKNDYDGIVDKVYHLGVNNLLNNFLITKDYSNKDGWTSYRIGEAFIKKNNLDLAIKFYQQAVKLAPYNLEFRNKYGVALFQDNKTRFAIDEFEFILNEDNSYISAYNNLGYIYFSLGDYKQALNYYDYALKMNPNHENTLINKSELLLLSNKKKDAFIYIERLLKVNPQNTKINQLLKNLDEI